MPEDASERILTMSELDAVADAAIAGSALFDETDTIPWLVIDAAINAGVEPDTKEFQGVVLALGAILRSEQRPAGVILREALL